MQNFLVPGSHIPLASHHFLNAESLIQAEKILANTVEPRRLSANPKSRKQGIQVNRFQLADIQIFGLHFDGPLSITSDKLESVNIIFPITGKLYSAAGGNTTTAAGFARIDSPGDRVCVEWDSSSTSLVTRIPLDTLNYYCGKLYDLAAYKNIRFDPVLDLSTNSGRSLQNILNTILLEADNAHSLLNQGVLSTHFQELFITALLNAQPNSLSALLHQQSHQIRPFYIKRAVEYIHEHAAELISLTDLVPATGVSLRALQSGFSKYYDVGPSAYIKQVKMQKAREELLASNSLETTVAEVAANWGFYNPCSFTGNYRKYFGENPSETLRRQKP